MATVVGDALEKNTALKRILRSALNLDGVARGLNEAARTLDRREAHFCIFAKNCDEPSYGKLVKALCHEHKIPIIEVDDKSELGELVGQCKYDKEGKARKVVGCSCAVVKNYCREDPTVVDALEFIEKNFKKDEKV